MCGIFGYFDLDRSSINKECIFNMSQKLKHRGPDAEGNFVDNGILLGNTRLSIIDIEGGNQPFYSNDRKIVIVQNGEIYNHLELADEVKLRGNPCRSKCDTEVLLRLYELDGINFLEKLNGMFSIAIYDYRTEELILVRDRIGIKPLYFYKERNKIIFASEIKSILQSGIKKPNISTEGLSHYFSFGFIPPPFTIYENIQHVMPGEFISFSKKGLYTRKWWDLSKVSPQLQIKEDDWIDEFNFLIKDSTRIRLRSDVPFGAFLSGGVDSSTIVGLMSEINDAPIKTFSIGFTDSKYDETEFAIYASKRFGTEHEYKIVEQDMLDLWPTSIYFCDQPHGDISFLPTFKVSEIAKKKVTVVLTGDGGDELFGGYEKYLGEGKCDLKNYFKNITIFDDNEKKRISNINHSDSFGFFNEIAKEVNHQDNLNKKLFLDMMTLLPGNNLVKPDRMGMAMSLEARTPFLDYRVMELAFKMPGTLKIKNNQTKYIYKKAVRNLIGDKLAYRKKQMFTVPVGEWFKEKKYNFCKDRIKVLQDKTNIINTDYINQLLEEHVKGARNCTREIRTIISLSYWIDQYSS